MPVLVRHHASDMTADQYSAIADGTMGKLRSATGFLAHYAFLEGDGLTLCEIWETKTDHDAYFDKYVQPRLPQKTPAPAVFDLLNATTAAVTVGGAARTAKHAVGVLGGAAGGAWSWTRTKVHDLTHRSEQANDGPEGDQERTDEPAPVSAQSEVPVAKESKTKAEPALSKDADTSA